MFAQQSKSDPNKNNQQAHEHSREYFEADPYLEWYDSWVVVRYTIKNDEKDERRHLTVPPSSIYSFNWDWKADKK